MKRVFSFVAGVVLVTGTAFPPSVAGGILKYKNTEGGFLATDTPLSSEKLREGGWTLVGEDQQAETSPAHTSGNMDERIADWNSAITSARTSLASRASLSEFSLERLIGELRTMLEGIDRARKDATLSNDQTAWLSGKPNEILVVLNGFVDELAGRNKAVAQQPAKPTVDEICGSGKFSTENHISYYIVYFTNTSPRDCRKVTARCTSTFWAERQTEAISYEGLIRSGATVKIGKGSPKGGAARGIDDSACEQR